MYARYTTPAFILSSYSEGEANQIFTCLTPEFGCISVHAQSVRALESKLRFGMKCFGHPSLEIVRGKGRWRLVGVVPKHFFVSPKFYPLLSRIGNLIERLSAGEEEKNEMLYYDVVHIISLASEAHLKDRERDACEMLLVIRILSRMGYWDSTLDTLPRSSAGFSSYCSSLVLSKTDALLKINQTLRATHL